MNNVSKYDQEMLLLETAVDHPQISEEKSQNTDSTHIKLEQPALSSLTRENDCSTRKHWRSSHYANYACA